METLPSKVKQSVCEKRPTIGAKQNQITSSWWRHFLKAKVTVSYLDEQIFHFLTHSAHSPDLTPCNLDFVKYLSSDW